MNMTRTFAVSAFITMYWICCVSIAAVEPNADTSTKPVVEAATQGKFHASDEKSLLKDLLSWYDDTVESLRERFKAEPDSEPTNKPSFDFSFVGDRASRSVNLITTLPIDSLDGYARGQVNYLRISSQSDVNSATRTSFSYLLQLEGIIFPTIGNVITPRGHFEVENDPTITTDPHLHISVFDEFQLKKTWLKGGFGFWAEFKHLYHDSESTDIDSNLNDYGLRAHVDLEFERKWIGFTMEVEILPQIGFDKFSIRTSPEVKIKFSENLSFRIISEIDYYSDRDRVIIEQFFDLFKPLDTSMTHLWCIQF